MPEEILNLYDEDAAETYMQARRLIIEEVFDGDDWTEQDIVRELAAAYSGGDSDPDSDYPHATEARDRQPTYNIIVPQDYDRLEERTGHVKSITLRDIPRK